MPRIAGENGREGGGRCSTHGVCGGGNAQRAQGRMVAGPKCSANPVTRPRSGMPSHARCAGGFWWPVQGRRSAAPKVARSVA